MFALLIFCEGSNFLAAIFSRKKLALGDKINFLGNMNTAIIFPSDQISCNNTIASIVTI